MSEESEKKTIKLLWSVQTQGNVEQAEQNGELRAQRDNRGCA